MSTYVKIKIDKDTALAVREVSNGRAIHSAQSKQKGIPSFRGLPVEKGDNINPGSWMAYENARVLNHQVFQGIVKYVIYSYQTPIAWLWAHDDDAPIWYVLDQHFSPTTSNHQSFARLIIRQTPWEIQVI